jgi:hypothetical protein
VRKPLVAKDFDNGPCMKAGTPAGNGPLGRVVIPLRTGAAM